MDHGHRVVLALVLLFVPAGHVQSGVQDHKPPVRPDVAKLVMPILDARIEGSECSAKDESSAKAEVLLGRLFKIKSSASDEALAALLNFYLGEATDEDLVHEVTKRGRRMLPYLRKYKTSVPTFEGRTYPSCLTLEQTTRTEKFEEVISAIRSGKVLGVD